jgi:hypothetical protein
MSIHNAFRLFSTNTLKILNIDNEAERECRNDVRLTLFHVHPDDDDRIHQRMGLI